MLGIPRRTLVVSIAVLVADQPIPPMDDDLGTLVDGDLPRLRDGFLLGRTYDCVPLGFLPADGPSVVPFNYMLVISHSVIPILWIFAIIRAYTAPLQTLRGNKFFILRGDTKNLGFGRVWAMKGQRSVAGG